jgi:hypothetical protein
MKFYLVAAGVSRVTSCEDKEKWLFCAVMFPPTDNYIRKTAIIVAQTFHPLVWRLCGYEQGGPAVVLQKMPVSRIKAQS